MRSTNLPEEKIELGARLAQFFQRFRILVLAVPIVVLAGFLVYIIAVETGKRQREDSALKAEAVQDKYAKWTAETAQEAKAKLGEQLLALITETINYHGGGYAEQRARLVRAEFYHEKLTKNEPGVLPEQWGLILTDLGRVATVAPDSYLADYCLMNAAAVVEEFAAEKGKNSGLTQGVEVGELKSALPAELVADSDREIIRINDLAYALYQHFINRYPQSVNLPRALFSKGRLLESAGEYAKAGELYAKMETDFSSSYWTRIARNRIISLKAQGLVK